MPASTAPTAPDLRRDGKRNLHGRCSIPCYDEGVIILLAESWYASDGATRGQRIADAPASEGAHRLDSEEVEENDKERRTSGCRSNG
jgi:hypothetical protein